MNLSALLSYKKTLEQYLVNDINTIVKQHAGHSLYVVKENEIQFPNYLKQLEQQYQQIHQSFVDYQDTLDNVLKELQKNIDKLHPTYLNNSFRLYSNEFVYESIDVALERKLELPEESTDYVETRIKKHGDWKHAGMIIRPGKEKWIENLVGCDPLYLVDINPELLATAIKKFNSAYQARLRTYTIKESFRKPMLTALPDNQFSFCLVYNFFNYKPIEVVGGYLTELFDKLKPGGTVAFTFNNCDEPGAVELVEKNFVCYTPGSLIMQLCQTIGYETTNVHQLDTACAWVEVSKPGTLSSLRGGQNLAKLKVRQKT